MGGIDTADSIFIFSPVLMRALRFTVLDDVELPAGSNNNYVQARRFELGEQGLDEARLAFNCASVYRTMATAGVLNRGADCDAHLGMFDLGPVSNGVPFKWSLPHFYRT